MTFLFKNFKKTSQLFYRSVKNGAQTTLHVAFSKDMNESGKFYANCRNDENSTSKYCRRMDVARDFWKATEKVTKVKLLAQ